MEIIGTCTVNYLDSKILLHSSNLRMNKELALALDAVNMHELKDYSYISLNILNKIQKTLEKRLIELYENERNVLHNPKHSKGSKIFKIGYKEQYLPFLDKTIFIYFSNSLHKKILFLDRVVFFLKKAQEKKRIGFIYKYPEGIEAKKLILWLQNFISDNNQSLSLKEKDKFNNNLSFYINNNLLTKKGNNYFYTHKALVFS